MSPTSERVPEELRNLVIARAEHLCEYCLIHEDDTFFGCEVDHIISVKHGGLAEATNLAFACVFCNRHKGSDIGSILPRTGEFLRFFNPRTDRWAEHFRLNGALIESLSGIGEVTARILGFNNTDRILERELLMAMGIYPPTAAKARLQD